MHELSLAEDMLLLIESQAVAQQFSRVEKVFLEIGQLSHVEAEAMRFCFDSVVKDTVADGAQLVIIETQGVGRCRDCQRESSMTHLYDPCEHCGAFALQVVEGDRVQIKSLEVI